jgi:hypothetical protein
MFTAPTNRVVFSASPLARFNSTRLRVTPRRAAGADFGVFECTKAIEAVKCRESGLASTARFSSVPVAMEAFSCTKLPVKTTRMPNQSAHLWRRKMRCAKLFLLLPVFSLPFFTFKARRKLKGIPAKNWTKSLEEIRAGKAAKRFSSHIGVEKDKLANDLDGIKRMYLEIKDQHTQ